MPSLTRNGTARLTIIAVVAALVAAVAAPIAAFAQGDVDPAPPPPYIMDVVLGKDNGGKLFVNGEVITVYVKFSPRGEVRVAETPEASEDDPSWQKLRLDVGGVARDATYVGIARDDPNIRQFTYTVQEGDAGKARVIKATEMLAHNMVYVYVGDADGCEGGETLPRGLLLMSMVGPLAHALPPDMLATPYTCDRYASLLTIPNPQNPLRYE